MANSALLQSMIDEVYGLTNRPDLVAETVIAVRAATLKAHHSDFYYKDLFETTITFAEAAYTPAFDYTTTIPRWRAANYMRKVSDGVAGAMLTLVTPQEILDSYGVSYVDIYYIAGLNVQIKSSTEIGKVIVGCYRHPDTAVATYESWIAREHPYAIIFDAAATIFKTIGYDEQNTAYQRMIAEQIGALRAGNIVAVGS